jgi:hypothetical protein
MDLSIAKSNFVTVKGTVSRDIQGNFMTWMDISTPEEELLLVKKMLRDSSNFILIFNILPQLMQKAIQ